MLVALIVLIAICIALLPVSFYLGHIVTLRSQPIPSEMEPAHNHEYEPLPVLNAVALTEDQQMIVDETLANNATKGEVYEWQD